MERQQILADQKTVMQRIAMHPFGTEPCTHFIADDIFPAELYTEIVRHWPNKEKFTNLNSTGRVPTGTYEARSVLMLTDQQKMPALPPDQVEFWELMRNWLNSFEFFDVIFQKFQDEFVQINSGDFLKKNFQPRPQLIIDDGYYAISPHTDAANRVIGLLFYCPADESIIDQGTSLYKLKPGSRIKPAQHPSGAHLPREEFDLVKTAAFAPNRLFAFVRSPISYHGVEPLETDGRRRTLSWKLLSAGT